MTIVNNVTRMLDAKKIPYQAHSLPLEKLSAVETAQLLGVSAEQVFKTIVAIRNGPGKPILAMISGNAEVQPKRLAALLNEKKIKVASHQQAEELTGLQTGGISPLALINQGFQIILDQDALNFRTIYISGGQRGLNLEISPKDLQKITHARLGNITSQH